MSKSLNQAFIKAYSKDKAQGTLPPQTAAIEPRLNLEASDFIVRFDTATCVVPSPYPQPSQKPKAVSPPSQPMAPAAPQVAPKSIPKTQHAPPPRTHLTAHPVAAHPAAALPAAALRNTAHQRAGESEAQRNAAQELRNVIASQMSRAGTWEAQSIDAFSGGFPMISPFHQRSGQAIAPTSGALKGPHFGHSESRQRVLAGQVPTATTGSVVPATPTTPVAPAALRAEFNQRATEHDQPLESTPRLSPLESPALTSNPQPSEREFHDAARLREAHAATHNPSGDIFRLDRPSYDHSREGEHNLPVADNVQWSGELSSEILGLSDSGTHIDLETKAVGSGLQNESVPPPAASGFRYSNPAPANVSALAAAAAGHHSTNSVATHSTEPVQSAERVQHVRSLERDLRRAKVRIFNPVWEVDSFQWPDICLELLQQRAEAMEMVARNLNEACQEGLQVLAVTSPHSGEGRTTVACCLAKLAGSRGLNVAIVDGDIENPTLSYQTNLDIEQDWKTAIFNQLPLEEVAVHSIADQVTLVPLTHPIAQHEMATDDNRIEFMLQELSESFDLVIVDMGHMDSSRSLVTSLGERGVISAVVAVVDYRSSTRQQVDHCLRRIRQTGVASIGLVENFAA